MAYSARMPGTTKPRLAGFMMSTTRATISTMISQAWARVSGASSEGVTRTPVSRANDRPGSNP
jgi:hypothetical protein